MKERLPDANSRLAGSEGRLRLLLDSTAEGIYRLDMRGHFTFCNRACLALLGYKRAEDLLGKHAHTLIHHTRDDGTPYPIDECGIYQALHGETGNHVVDEILWRSDGTSFPVEYWSYPIREEGKPVGCVVTFVDITERKRAEEALRQSEHRFSLAFNQSPVATCISEAASGRMVNVNERFLRMLGYEREQVIGRTSNELGIWSDPVDRERLAAALDGAESTSTEVRLRTRSGEIRDVVGSIVRIELGNLPCALSTFLDITERKRSEIALRESEARQRAVFDAAPDALVTMDHAGKILEFNPAAEQILGFSREEVLGKPLADLLIPPDLRDRHRRGLARYLATGEAAILDRRLELPALRKDGAVISAELTITRSNVEDPPVFTGFLRDITDRKRAEKEIRKSEERFRRLFDSNTIGIAVADLSGGIVETNDAYLAMLGYTREDFLAGRFRWDQLTPPEFRALDQVAVEQLQKTGVAQPWEKEFLRKDGSRVSVVIGVAMLEASEESCIAYIVDLSARRQLEVQLRQAQKMEAIGQLGGGVAHDFNNLLTVILGYSDLLATEVGEKSPLMESIGEIRKSGERAASLTRQLLAFSRRQVLEPKVLEVNALVSNLEKMLHRLIGEDMDLVTVLDPAVGRVHADAGQIEQVILNLAVNSRDAMPRGGKLTIETSNVDLDEAYAREHVTVRPGSYVMLAVADTGTGMSAETKSHIFEPFFTTKGQGKGTGLGLATVYGIVKQSGGYIWLYSELGRGTTFKVYLPRVDASAEEKVAPAVRPSTRGTETILLVEDDQAVRALTRTLLEAKGYKVLEASGADEAIAIGTDPERPIDLLLTDVVMPEMGGSDLSSRLVVLRPGLKVLYMSGYTDDAVVRHGLVAEGARFLQKPFTPDVLARKLREVLDS